LSMQRDLAVIGPPASDTPDELSNVAKHRRENLWTKRKDADQGEMNMEDDAREVGNAVRIMPGFCRVRARDDPLIH
jgi:hypothetical protein